MESVTRARFIGFILDNAPLVCIILFYPLLVVVSAIYLLVQVLKPKAKYDDSLRGQVAVITGSAGGLGREIAIELAKRGCHIAVVDIQYKLAEETAASLAQLYSVRTKAYKVDVTNYQQLQELETKVTIDLGTPTILINNAGILMLSSAQNPPSEEISRMINVNLTAICYTTQIFLPKMKELNRGHIVNISSLSALMCFPNFSIYGSTKAAVRVLTSMLRTELMYLKRNITATTVMPAFMNTNSNVEKLLDLGGPLGQLMNVNDGDKVAHRIVDSMLNGVDELIIPDSAEYCCKLLALLPTYVREKCLALISESSYHSFVRSPKVGKILKQELQRNVIGTSDLNENNCK